MGAKMALTILSGFPVDEFVRHIEGGDITALTRLPGVGKKTAERLVIEMRDRIAKWNLGSVVSHAADGRAQGAVANVVSDAINALVALGYKEQEASKMVRALDTANLGSEEIIRKALQMLV